MPAPANVSDFLEVVRKSGLVPEDRLDAEVTRFQRGPAAPQTIDQFAAALIRSGVITRFQAKQFKTGRYKRFEIAGKYRLLELLGIGGMGTVYLCEHVFLKKLVALKLLPQEKLREQSALLRFYREARAVAALDHPNIVRAYDIDKFEGLHFLVMEYVDGASIQDIVARNGPLAPDRAAHYVAQAALGLQHAHELGMVHRDIKPGNLLLERTGTVKILDMGLSRFFDQTSDNITERFDANSILGTADYLAPEQSISNVVDVRADIYALGGSLYFMLTGRTPFPDGPVAAKLVAHQSQEPKPVAEFRPDVPDDLLAVLHTMMRKDPAERYQTPAEVFDALVRWADFPVPPPPANEMPDLCPAVLALAGHSVERGRGSTVGPSGPRTVGRIWRPSQSGLMAPGRPTPPPQAAVPTVTPSATAPLGPLHPGKPDPVPLIAAAAPSRVEPTAPPAPSPAERNRWLLIGLVCGFVLASLLYGAIAVIGS